MKRLTAALVACLLAVTAHAATLKYEVSDHPGGLKTQYDYGLRLDSQGKFFSFDGASTAVLTLDVTGSVLNSAVISGSMVENDLNGAVGLWDLTFTLTGLSYLGDGAFTATGATGSLVAGATTLLLNGKQDNSGIAFYFQNDGHRIGGDVTTPVGRGWVDPSMPCCDDFLFTAELGQPGNQPPPIPLPSGGALLLGGVAVLVAARRRMMQRGF